MNKSLSSVDYQIIHATPGRIRISVPQLKQDSECASQIEQLINSLDFVVRVRLNPLASSIAIRYEANGISEEAVVEQIASCFRQVVQTINIYQQNQKYLKVLDVKVEKAEEELAGKVGGEAIGEIVGGVIGEVLLGHVGGTIGSHVMGKVGGLIGESINSEVADVMGLLQHLESQGTKKIRSSIDQINHSQQNGLTASQLEKLWQIPSSTIVAQADEGVTAFECWSQEIYGTRWTFVFSNPAKLNSEKLFFPV